MTEWIYRVVLMAALGATVITGALRAQQVEPMDEATRLAFQRARLVAEVEQDLPRAARLLTELTRDAASDVAKTRAWLLLADVHSRLGDTKAAEAALREAAAGDGEAAGQAKQRLAKHDDVVQQATKLLETLRRAPLPGIDDQLVWLGPGVIPLAIADADRYAADLGFVTRVSELLYRMRDPEVSDWLVRVAAESPVLVQRAVIRGIQGEAPQGELRAGLRAFAESENPAVLADALRKYPRLFSKQQVIGWLADEDQRLRQGAIRALGEWKWLGGEDSMEIRCSLLDTARELRHLSGEEIAKAIPKGIRNPQTEADVDLFIDFLRAQIPMRIARRPLPVSDAWRGFSPVQALELARELVDASDAVRASVTELVSYVASIWTRSAIPEVIELRRLDFLVNSTTIAFAGKHARGEDWALVFDLLPKLRAGSWTSQIDEIESATLPSSAFDPLRRFVEQDLSARLTKELGHVLLAVAAIRSPEATQWLTEFMSSDRYWNAGLEESLREYRTSLFEFVLRSRRTDPQWADALLRWTSEDCGGLATRDSRLGALKRLLFAIHDVRGVDRVTELVAGDADLKEIYQRLGTSNRNRAGPLPRPVVEALVDVAVRAQPHHFWVSVFRWRGGSGGGQTDFGKCPHWLHEKFVEHLATVPAYMRIELLQGLTNDPGVPGATELVRRSLISDDPEVREVAVKRIAKHFSGADRVAVLRRGLGDPSLDVLQRAIGEVRGAEQAELVPELVALADHEVAGVRAHAFGAIADLDPDAAEDVALKLVDDPSRDVQIALCYYAKDTVNRRLAPTLVEFLRSPGVSEHAQAALDAIRYYHEEKSRWDRIASGTDLTATSAAEALVRQATQGENREIRLIAIRSLGTLGVPETLPILINMLGDRDADIVTAVREAILTVQAAGSKK